MEAFLIGASLGFWAGVSPGPLLAFVLREALQKGPRAGIMAALAPLVSDSWAVALAWLLAGALPTPLLGALSKAGGLYLIYLGLAGLLHGARSPAPEQSGLASLRGAVLTNLTNPHMYVFWFAVGGPLLRKLGRAGSWFLLGFFVLIVASKSGLALLAAALRSGKVGALLAPLSDVFLLAIGLYLLLAFRV